jgi:uncharacterized membrane protein YoaK (UPF0700 family)
MATAGNYAADRASRARGGTALTARRLSPTTLRDLLLAGLTFASGAVDAIAFLALGKVFTAFQTGNLVFLGIAVADAGGPDVLRVACSLGGFAVGVLVGTRVVQPSRGSSLWPSRVSVALGLAFVAQAVFLALWVAVSGRPGSGTAHALAAVSALAMGMQSAAVLSLGVTGVFTTAATATVIFLMRNEADRAKSQGTERARLAGVLVALSAGAAAAGLLLVHAHTYAPVIPLVATALVIAVAATALRRKRP